MKKLLIILLVSISSIIAYSQASTVVIPQSEWKAFFSSKHLSLSTWDYKKTAIIAGISIIQGFSNGIHEALYRDPNRALHNSSFLRSNQQWFDPRVSWNNKYDSNGNERFPGSTSIFVFTTDHHHFDRDLLLQGENIKTTLIFTLGSKPNWEEWLINTFIGNAVRGITTDILIRSLR